MKKILLALLLFPVIIHAQTWTSVGSSTGFSVGKATYTSIAIDPAGTPYVAFIDYVNAQRVTVMKYESGTWVNVGAPGFSAPTVAVAIAIDNAGTPYVLFNDTAHGYNPTLMKYVGSSWTTVGSADFSPMNVYELSVAIDGTTGIPYVAINGGSSSGALVMKYDGSWVIIGSTSYVSAGAARHTTIAMDGSTPYISYQDATVNKNGTTMKFNGTSWETVGTADFTSAGMYGVNYTCIAISGHTPYVVYKDASYGWKATVKKYDGTNWVNVGTPGFSAGIVWNTTIAIDAGGTPYVSYVDSTNGNKATVKKYDGSNWVTVGSVGFSAGDVYYPSIAINSIGTPYVAYQDTINSRKACVMKFGAAVGIRNINSFSENDGAEIFPNPASNELTIKVEPDTYSSFSITNTIGQQMMQNSLSLPQTIVDIHDLPSGLYFVSFKGDNGTVVKKFIKM